MKEKLGTAFFCLMFVLTFGAVGAGAMWVIGGTIYDGNRANDWVRVKADLQTYGNGTISYTYKFGEKTYVGDRLGSSVIGGTDNMDSWHEDVDAYLSEAKTGGKPIHIWVNPDNPKESMLDRSIRWKFLMFASVFGLAFGGVGLGAFIAMIVTLLPEGVKKRAPKLRKDVKDVGALWGFTFFWSVISFPVAILFIPQIVEDGEWLGLIVLLFPLVGVLLIWGCLAATWKIIKDMIRGVPEKKAVPAAKAKPKSKMVETMDFGSPQLPQQVAAVGSPMDQLTPEQLAQVEKLKTWGPKASKVVIWIIVGFVVLQFGSAIVGVVWALLAN